MRAFLLSLLLVGLAPLTASAQLALTFEPQAVVANGVTPNAQVAWLGVVRDATGVSNRAWVTQEIGGPADGQGSASLVPSGPLGPKAVWAAVDLSTGGLALAAPEPSPLREEPLGPGALLAGPGGEVDRVLFPHRRAALLLVRPGEGAWSLVVGDGSAADADGAVDNAIVVTLPDLTPLGSSAAPPSALQSGDVLAIVDPESLTVTAAELAE